MKTDDMDFMQLIPAFMKDDGAVKGLAAGVNQLTEELSNRLTLFKTWNQIDNMSGAELDLLADELHISWYDKFAGVDVKRELIKNSDLVHAKMGTNWAVQNVIETYFGSGMIEDWYDYNGEPFHFKILTTNMKVTTEKAEQFLSILNKVKRKSAWLDGIELIANGTAEITVFLISCEKETLESRIEIKLGEIEEKIGYTYEDLSYMTHEQIGKYTNQELRG